MIGRKLDAIHDHIRRMSEAPNNATPDAIAAAEEFLETAASDSEVGDPGACMAAKVVAECRTMIDTVRARMK